MTFTPPVVSDAPSATAQVTPAVRAQDAVKVYGQGETAVRALDGISVAMERGGFTAIMGPSGSGKSTLLHCLAGLDRLTSGHVFLGDIDITTLHDKQLTMVRRDRVGFIFQAYNLVPTLNAEDNITLPLRIAGRKPDPAWFNNVVDVLALRPRLKHLPKELSGGQQQRVAAARALVSRPEVIFADEPSGNLDAHSSAELLSFLKRAVHEFGQTIVMVTHDPNSAVYADRVVFLNDGRIVHDMPQPTVDSILEVTKGVGS
jgi:putative ABC transport system ATP-binding protein